ncbi:MAG: ABC transporter ATP-binding protein [Ruminococcus sp.]|nr:ABC transporter ATP-binding protein [Ruminococcus sp.]
MKNNATKWLFDVPKKKKLYILLLSLIQAVYGASGVFYAILLRSLVDSATKHDSNAFWFYALAIMLLVLGQILLRAVIRWLNELSKATFENIFKQRLMSNILRKDFGSVNAIHSGEWLNRLTNDTVVIAEGYVEIIPGIVGMVVKMVSALIMMIAIDWHFACVLLPGGVLMLVLTYIFRKAMKKLHKSVQENDGKLRIFLQERISSMMIIRSFATEDETEAEAVSRMKDHKDARMKRNHYSNLCNIGLGLAMNGMYLFGVAYCGYGILKGRITFGTLTAVTQLISQIQAPLASLSGYLPKFYAMTASAERLMEIEDFADDCEGTPKDISEVREFYTGRLASFGLKNADFTYYPAVESINALSKEAMPTVLNNISIDIRKGEYVAFMGHSGCGKSTVLKLLMSIYKLDSGERYITETDGTVKPLSSEWHRLFAYVPQGNQLMSGTIRDVIAFADKSAANDSERIGKALTIACADEFISGLENGIDTQLGERGTGLSEGQMQRIAIARAIFSESPILLLDESTSALDELTEKKLLQNLKNMTDKTVVIVTHRTAALAICDRTIDFTGLISK